MKDGVSTAAALVERDMKRPKLRSFVGGCAAVYSARCPGKETSNEDAAAVIQLEDDSIVLVVADGMGGAMAGEKASALAVEALISEFEAYDSGDDQLLRATIMNGIEHGNEAVRGMGLGAATTLAVVQVQDRTVRPYHVGDSLVLVVGNKGKIKLQTVAHSPVGYGVEAGLLDEAEAMHHDDRHVVSNIVGTEEMRIEVGAPLKMAQRDTLVIASDGLADNLHVDEIVELIRKGPLNRSLKKVVTKARQRMTTPQDGCPSKPDDMTVLAFRLANSADGHPHDTSASLDSATTCHPEEAEVRVESAIARPTPPQNRT